MIDSAPAHEAIPPAPVPVPSSPPPSLATLSLNPTTPNTPTTTSDAPPSTSSPPNPPLSSRSHDPSTSLKRTDPFQFGSRHLLPHDNPYEFNAWDHVPPTALDLQHAEAQYAAQRQHPVSPFDAHRFNADPAKWWNLFYAHNTTNFFKDRKWLHQEFPLLARLTRADAPPATILEVGAGAGNTAFPILKLNRNPGLRVVACDFSKRAVELIRSNEAYCAVDESNEAYLAVDASNEAYRAVDDTANDAYRGGAETGGKGEADRQGQGEEEGEGQKEKRKGTIEASVWDVADETKTRPEGITAGSVDVVLMIFIFSALSPRQWRQAVRNVWGVLREGGEVLFRDYGRGDLAQVRFKKGRYLEENFYVRGDGTRVYFFELEELRGIWNGAALGKEGYGAALGEEGKGEEGGEQVEKEGGDKEEGTFEVLDLGVDRRMLVNRQKQLKMYRCWMQGRFRKGGAQQQQQQQ